MRAKTAERGRPVQVAVAVIRDHQGRVLLSRRRESLHQGGLWEFPGGKLEAGETPVQALERELREELGLALRGHRPLIRVSHSYAERRVLLDVHLVTDYAGAPRGLEGQPLAWVPLEALHLYPLPAADRPIVCALALPDRYLITPLHALDRGWLPAALARAIEAGQRLFQLRVAGEPASWSTPAVGDAMRLCREHGARLLLNAEPGWVAALGADGVHLSSRRLMSLQARPLESGLLVGASCHSAEELRRAERIGADFAVLSPVLATASHPAATPLGWERFAELVGPARIPVYALGGMHAGVLGQAWAAGAQGIAGIGTLWPGVA